MQYLITFLEGIISFISPCLLPMIPIYISYFAGESQDKKKVLPKAIAFVCGFTTVFLLLGLFAGALGTFLARYKTAVNIVCGLIVIFFGLHFWGVVKLNFLNGLGIRYQGKGEGLFSSYLFGLVFSVSWTPCVGAFLGSALMLASGRGSVVQGVLLLFAYSAGLGIPFVLSALLIENLKTAFGVIKRHYALVNAISGIFLIVTGILMMTGLLDRVLGILA